VYKILSPILTFLVNIIGYPLYQLWLLIRTPVMWFFTTFRFVTVLSAILTIPLANYVVYKSKKATNKQKLGYVSIVTILLGFMMVLLEL
jgi:membrane protein implicated in regulation of membrane protease activity